jgi:hypothetical protein
LRTVGSQGDARRASTSVATGRTPMATKLALLRAGCSTVSAHRIGRAPRGDPPIVPPPGVGTGENMPLEGNGKIVKEISQRRLLPISTPLPLSSLKPGCHDTRLLSNWCSLKWLKMGKIAGIHPLLSKNNLHGRRLNVVDNSLCVEHCISVERRG